MAYPSNMYSSLCLVDALEKMGISHHFSCEINSILDKTYRSWLQNDQEMMVDMETCAMAFRILRAHGYAVSSDVCSHIVEESRNHDSVQGHLNDTKTLLELYKASHLRILEDEWNLGNIGSWSGKLLKQQSCSKRMSRLVMLQEVEYAIKMPFYSATVQIVEHKRNVEHFVTKSIQMRKSAYMAYHATEDILALATKEFNSIRSLYQKEVECLERWVVEVRLDQLKYVRLMPVDFWIFIASDIFPSELSEARVEWVKNAILTIAVDDFFDVGGSTEELENLVGVGFSSEDVEISFYAIYNTNNRIGAKAMEVQNRSVIGDIAELWVDFMRGQRTEAEWQRKGYIPTMEEYMPVSVMSLAYGPIPVPSLYLIGPELSDDMFRSSEFQDMFKHTSVCARLLNDLHTYNKERRQGSYVNGVLLHAHRHSGSTSSASIEAAKEEIRKIIAISQRELLRLVLRDADGIPRQFREIWWNMRKGTHLFYLLGDGFCAMQLVAEANGAVYGPLEIEGTQSCKEMS
ncbi:hypothetical protein EJB05_21149 [Eragrostis curvula]|uniref:Terpene synthase metal-binding domain-containing protein n=1 Tax=Eragrostis curvula TaxID=38414 RepID=A0A5J9V0Y7_9POAL|nr:hypothetical protein EJB05_21149 [Eragrostis curvula]